MLRQILAYAAVAAMAGVTWAVAKPYEGVDHWAIFAGGCVIAVILAAIIAPDMYRSNGRNGPARR
jgi:hypothetical protein